MATPCRRSARLRGNTPQSAPQTEALNPTPSKTPSRTPRLSSLTERDEAANSASYANIESIADTPAKPSTPSSSTSASQQKSSMKTPKTAGRPQPGHAEMHPSKVQQSTKKLSNSVLRSGSRTSMGLDGTQDSTQNTPSRSKGELSSQLASPNVDFNPFASEESQLSADARKLMEKVREDATRIKEQMILGKSEQDRKEGEAEKLFGGRKIAQAKGKAGRFSQAHMAEFKKMDSIEGHASSYRTQPGRVQTPVKSLKRTNSKACLDEPEKKTPKSTGPPNQGGNSVPHTTKRPKKRESDDTSTQRPVSRDGLERQDNSSLTTTKPKHRLPTATKTPTRIARFQSASVKNPKKTAAPSPTRSPSVKQGAAPKTPKTEFNPKMKSGIPTLGSLKSILRRHQPLFSNDPVKIAAGTHVASPQFEFNKNLLRGAEFPSGQGGYTTPSVKKHVDFTSSTKSPNDHVDVSPSPSKASAPANVAYPSLPALYPSLSSPSSAVDTMDKEAPRTTKSAVKKSLTPSIRHIKASDISPTPKAIPNIPSVPHGITNKKRRRDQVNDDDDTENKTPAEVATPDGRDHKRLKANPPATTKAATPSPIKMRPFANVTPRRGTPSRTPGRTPSSARQRSRGVLSMSRLNMLSKPKERR